ncbi:hypothetical protein PR048_033444 [Dryococelus australis]|uniref:Uncharacterized protein n=1 Tax=Dryococelus australis TaxID=614101 RepID=A0ABQ9G4F6_9NEOP|nr:hypothetical protein PR048_033444 [Dryococelus australis]
MKGRGKREIPGGRPAEQRHRPALFPLAKIRRTGQGLTETDLPGSIGARTAPVDCCWLQGKKRPLIGPGARSLFRGGRRSGEYNGVEVAQWLGRSPPTTAIRVRHPAGFTPGLAHVGFVLDDAACRRAFSGHSRFPRPCIPSALISCHVPTGKPVTRVEGKGSDHHIIAAQKKKKKKTIQDVRAHGQRASSQKKSVRQTHQHKIFIGGFARLTRSVARPRREAPCKTAAALSTRVKARMANSRAQETIAAFNQRGVRSCRVLGQRRGRDVGRRIDTYRSGTRVDTPRVEMERVKCHSFRGHIFPTSTTRQPRHMTLKTKQPMKYEIYLTSVRNNGESRTPETVCGFATLPGSNGLRKIGRFRADRYNDLLDSSIVCTLGPQMFVHWLMPQRVASVTSHLGLNSGEKSPHGVRNPIIYSYDGEQVPVMSKGFNKNRDGSVKRPAAGSSGCWGSSFRPDSILEPRVETDAYTTNVNRVHQQIIVSEQQNFGMLLANQRSGNLSPFGSPASREHCEGQPSREPNLGSHRWEASSLATTPPPRPPFNIRHVVLPKQGRSIDLVERAGGAAQTTTMGRYFSPSSAVARSANNKTTTKNSPDIGSGSSPLRRSNECVLCNSTAVGRFVL